MQIYTGAIQDPIDIRDFKREELAKSTIPNWIEKKTYRSYPVRNQAQSLSCVAQGVSTILGSIIQRDYGKYLEVSARPIYIARSNKPSGGMIFREAMQIGAGLGSTFEFSVPSQNMTEEQMNDSSDIKEIDSIIASIINGYNYFSVPFSFDAISAIIEEGNALIVGFMFDYSEWDVEFPTINQSSTKSLHHCVTIVDYTLINGKKYLVVQDSWGKDRGKNGLRFISEDWISRMTACWYYDKLDYKSENDFVSEVFTSDLELGMHNQDVKRLQIFLKRLGFFPDIEVTYYYGPITADAVKKFQLAKGIIKNKDDSGAGRLGPITRSFIGNMKQA